LLHELFHAFIAILAIMNPVASAPIFSTITSDLNAAQRRRAVGSASLTVFGILIGSALLGKYVLQAFGVGVPAFQFGGGIVILLMGLEMLHGSTSRVHKETSASEEDDDIEDRIFVPFAMPLVAGPGAIATVITLTAHGSGSTNLVAVLIAIAAASFALLFTLSIADRLTKRLPARTMRIITRFMGLIILTVGAQFVLAGFHAYRPM